MHSPGDAIPLTTPPLQFDGSRRHVLDWTASPDFLDTIRGWVQGHGLTITEKPEWRPRSWQEPRESKLFESGSRFLSGQQRECLKEWWLAVPESANIPNWDLIVTADCGGRPALVLVEAKAHVDEFDCKAKPLSKRDNEAAQERTAANHARIGQAIDEASRALAAFHGNISLSSNKCYQLANRIAMAWKLASMGIPNTLVFLGFTGDDEISGPGRFFEDDPHWQKEFAGYSVGSFPGELFDREIPCGSASFRLIAKSLRVQRPSRHLSERRAARGGTAVSAKSAAKE